MAARRPVQMRRSQKHIRAMNAEKFLTRITISPDICQYIRVSLLKSFKTAFTIRFRSIRPLFKPFDYLSVYPFFILSVQISVFIPTVM
jgi:hypothetical protein